MELTNSTLHHWILQTIVSRGHAPTVVELSDRFSTSEPAMAASLQALADYHGVALHPDSSEIWVAHPFSLAPTGFTVVAGERRWWGTCAWCSLGVVALVGGTATISTQLAWSGRQVQVRIEDSQLLDADYVVHFPIPMTAAWDNVIYTCSMMLLFADSAAVAKWCRHHGKPQGDVRPIEQIWHFSQEWYGRHLDRDWTKWSVTEAAEIFARHGLSGPIWDLPDEGDRF